MRRQPRAALAVALALIATPLVRADEPPAPTPAPEPKKAPTLDEVRKRSQDQGGLMPDILGEAARLYHALPDDRDVRMAYAQTQMALPPDDQRSRRRFPGRPPRFEKVVEALEPIVKAEPENAEAQLMLGV